MTASEALVQLKQRITPEWVRETLGEDCTGVEVRDFVEICGLSNDMFLLTTHGSISRERVVKTFLGDAQLQKSLNLGLWREGAFFQYIYAEHVDSVMQQKCAFLRDFIPTAYYSEGNSQTGEKLIIMEKLVGGQSGLFLAPNHPIFSTKNGKARAELERLQEAGIVCPTENDVYAQAFRLAARLHATFWKDHYMLQTMTFLRGRDCLLSTEDARSGWELAQKQAVDGWRKILHGGSVEDTVTDSSAVSRMRKEIEYRKEPSDGDQDVHLGAHLVDCVTSSLSKIDFDEYCDRRHAPDAYPWHLVHGDFYPGNTFEQFIDGKHSTKLLDLEMIGWGSGPQDLGQYMISNTDPSYRRKCEEQLVCTTYYNELVALLKSQLGNDDCDPSIPSVERVWDEYKYGGAGRWLWFIPILVTCCPSSLAQFFCDQVSAFLEDHFPGVEGASRAPVPRV